MTPLRHLLRWIALERKDLWVLVVYGACTILLSLAAPFAVQTLVNTIAAGVFLQPLVVTIGILLIALLLAGTFKILQFHLVEILQQRLFANIALEIAQHVPAIDEMVYTRLYGPELVNRFFDVVNIQKSLSKLLLIWPTSLIQVIVGLAVMALYSPVFLLFDLAILLFGVVIFLLGLGGMKTSLQESHHKYELAYWLQELSRCHNSLKLAGLPPFLMQKADGLVTDYLHARSDHFKVLQRQAWGVFFFQAIAHAGLLGLGGWLVISRQLTIGQLVAAELVLVTLLLALENLTTNASVVYDLLTAFVKVGHILEQPGETSLKAYATLANNTQGMGVELSEVSFDYPGDLPALHQVSLSLRPGSRAILVGPSGAGKTTLAKVLAGILPARQGLIKLDELDLKGLSVNEVRRQVGWVSQEASLFDGTVEENLCLGSLDSDEQNLLTRVLRLSHLGTDLDYLPQGLQTRLVAEGKNMPFGLRQRILLARALMKQPRLLILDEALAGLDEREKGQIMQGLYEQLPTTTMLTITQDPVVALSGQQVWVMQKGRVVDWGSPAALVERSDSLFNQLFPSAACLLKKRGMA